MLILFYRFVSVIARCLLPTSRFFITPHSGCANLSIASQAIAKVGSLRIPKKSH